MSVHFEIRPVENNVNDLEYLSKFCHELAEFDHYEATMDAEKLSKTLFYPNTSIKAFFAVRNGDPIGFILAYECFTVYHGERGLQVSGSYIVEQYRYMGYGVRLFKFLGNYAIQNGFSYLNWIVEEDNKKANSVYRKIGATISNGWSYVRLSKDILEKTKG
jgi:ribosomal protein S18 acetylase RimI-like enzyme